MTHGNHEQHLTAEGSKLNDTLHVATASQYIKPQISLMKSV